MKKACKDFRHEYDTVPDQCRGVELADSKAREIETWIVTYVTSVTTCDNPTRKRCYIPQTVTCAQMHGVWELID